MKSSLDQHAELTRYMPLSKFVAFLVNGISCPASHFFEDPWEGHTYFNETVSSPSSRENLARLTNKARAWIYTSCWHYAEAESYAMWQIYGRSDDAVAIHSTVGRLKSVAMDYVTSRRKEEIAPLAVVTQVRYAKPGSNKNPFEEGSRFDVCFDHDQLDGDQDKEDWIGLMAGGFGVKLDAYEYEKEVRLLVLHKNAPKIMQIISAPAPEKTSCLAIPVLDLPSFLTGITVSPKAPDWFLGVLKELTKAFGIDSKEISIKKSTLLTGPGNN